MSTQRDLVNLNEAATVTAPAPVSETGAILSMIERAARDPSVDLDKFERLMAMRERMESQQAKRDFNDAMARAKGEIGPIVRNRVVDFTSQKGRTNYRYEDFASVAKAIDPVFTKYGLDYRFRSAQEGQRVRVTCIITGHGHSEETTLECAEDHSGNKNTIQAIGSAAQYLMRYTLKLAVGLSITDDDDGKSASGSAQSINDEQFNVIEGLLEATGSDRALFLKHFGIADVALMPARTFPEAKAALERKLKGKNNG